MSSSLPWPVWLLLCDEMKQNRPEPRQTGLLVVVGWGSFLKSWVWVTSLLYLNMTLALASTESFSTCAAGRTSQPAGRVCWGRFRLSQTVHRDSAGAAEQATDEVSASPLTARRGLQSWSQKSISLSSPQFPLPTAPSCVALSSTGFHGWVWIVLR